MTVVNLKKPIEKIIEDHVGKKFLFGYITIENGVEKFATYLSEDLDDIEACYLVDIINRRRTI